MRLLKEDDALDIAQTTERRIVMDEYISKQKVLDYLNGYLHSLGNGGADTLLFDRGQRRALINSIQDISAVKAADVQPVKHGRWIVKNGNGEYGWCSECGNRSWTQWDGVMPIPLLTPFCPYCSARMDKEAE